VQGQTIYVIPPFVSYGRQGATIVLGAKADAVADALNNGVKKAGLLSDEKFGSRFAKSEGTVFLLAAKPLTMAAKSLPMGMMFMPAEPRAIVGKMIGPIQLLAKSEEPIVLHVTRSRDALTAEFVVSGLKEIVPRAVDLGVEMFYEQRFAPPRKTPAFERKQEDKR
jgi:hypothetical protein